MNIFQLYFNKQRLFLEALTKTKSLFLVLIVSLTTWILFFTYVYFTRTTIEPEVQLLPAQEMSDVQFTLEIKSFSKFDINKDEFTADAIIKIDFDPRAYTPQDFTNFRIQNGQVVLKSAPLIEQNGEIIHALYEVSLTLRSHFKYADFPFDKHKIDIIFTNLISNKKTLSLKPENISLVLDSPNLGPGWNLSTTKINSGIDSNIDNTNNAKNYRIIFSIFTHRSSPKTAILVLMPLMLLFFLQLISLTFEVTKDFGIILSLSVGSVSGFLFYRNVMERLMPITDDFTIADKVYLLLMLYNIIILGIQIYILHYFRKLQMQTTLTQLLDRAVNNINILRGCIFILCLLALLVSTFFILW